jgi:integrase
MAGQLIKRGERTWLVRIFLGRDEKGKRRYANKTVRGTKKDAEKYLNAALRDNDLGTFVAPSPLTVNEFLDKWLETALRPSVRPNSFGSYSDVLRLYVRPVIGALRLSDLTPLHIQNLCAKLQEREPKLSARTIRYTHCVLSGALKQAVKWRILAQNPAAMVELPRHTRKEMLALSPEEAKRFLAAAVGDRWHALFVLALATGMRPSEYLGLKWSDVDLENGLVTVRRALIWRTWVKGGWYFGEPKTPRSRRRIPLPVSVLRALLEHRRRQAEERLKAGPCYQNFDLVFAGGEGNPVCSLDIIRRHFKPTLERAGLPQALRLYDLRHSCATLLLSENENPKVVSERLGHANIVLTLDTYSHVLPSMQQAASEKLESILFEKSGTR